MKHTTEKLMQLGLTNTEVNLYLMGLNYESISVSELVKQTRINRTTIYHALETLMQKGLVAKKDIGIKQVFSMTSPENLQKLLDEKINILKQQKKEFADIISLLQQDAHQKETAMKVLHYQGIEGIKLVVEDALYCKSKHWDIISPVKNFFSEFDKTYAKYFVTTRRNRELTSRSLWESDPSHKNLTPDILHERNPRILPKIMHGKFKSVICLYDDKVLVISSLNELSAILIQSQELNETMSAIYEGLWQTSTSIK